MGKQWEQWEVLFLASKSLLMVTAAMKLRCLLLERKAMTNLDSVLKSRDITANKGPYKQSYDFSSSLVWMWEFDHTEGWVLKNWCFQIVVLQRTLESPLHSKELKLVYPKGSKQLIFIGRTDAEVETSIPWSLMWRADLLGKPWCWERLRAGGEGMTEDELVR